MTGRWLWWPAEGGAVVFDRETGATHALSPLCLALLRTQRDILPPESGDAAIVNGASPAQRAQAEGELRSAGLL